MSDEEPGERSITEQAARVAWVRGLQVGRYTLLAKIATGGMAEIWLARQAGPKGFEKIMVIKKILDTYCEDEGFVEMFLDEARIAAQLNHPNIVQIYDLGEWQHSYYIAMEYLAGETVSKIARASTKAGQPLPYVYAAWIIARAAEGLHFAHAKTGPGGKPLGVIHRDISPQNLMVTYDGQVKVLDFGVAKAANRASRTEEGKFKGKIAYMAPEQARTEEVDSRLDLFALGVILYEIVGRCRLFQYDDQLAALKAVASFDPIPSPKTRNPDLPDALCEVVSRAVEREPSRRYQTGRELQLGLEDWLKTQPDAPGTNELAAYMQQLFAERIATNARALETVSAGTDTGELVISGEVSMPGSRSSKSGTPPPDLDAPAPRRRPGVVAGALAGVVALGVAGYLAFGGKPEPVQVPPPLPPVTANVLAIESKPAGAAISVDGKALGSAPLSVDPIGPGPHRVQAVLPDFEPAEETVSIHGPGERSSVLLTLRPITPVVVAPPPDAGEPAVVRVAKGKLTLSTTPWSEVYEGGRKLGETPLVDHPMPVGKHTLKLKNKEKGLEKTVVVEIKAGQTTAVKQRL